MSSTSRSRSATRSASSRPSPASNPPSAASIWRTSRPRTASSSNGRSRSAWASRSSMTTSTAPPSWSARPSSTACGWSARTSATVRLVTAGAGAAALACLDLLVALGLKRENVIVTDIAGVVYQGRAEVMDPYKGRYAVDTDAAHPGAGDRGRRRLPGALRRRGAEARVAGPHGGAAHHHGARQPDPGDHARPGPRGPPGRHHRHRALGLIPIRSTTSSASPSSSAAPWTAVPPRSTRR